MASVKSILVGYNCSTKIKYSVYTARSKFLTNLLNIPEINYNKAISKATCIPSSFSIERGQLSVEMGLTASLERVLTNGNFQYTHIFACTFMHYIRILSTS